MYTEELPFTLKICYAFFFIQGAFGMFLSMIIWFYADASFLYKLILLIFLVLYFILNIEIGKGLKKLKKWAFIVSIILCVLQTILVFIGYSDFSLFTIACVVVITLLLTLKNLFWRDKNDIYQNENET